MDSIHFAKQMLVQEIIQMNTNDISRNRGKNERTIAIYEPNICKYYKIIGLDWGQYGVLWTYGKCDIVHNMPYWPQTQTHNCFIVVLVLLSSSNYDKSISLRNIRVASKCSQYFNFNSPPPWRRVGRATRNITFFYFALFYCCYKSKQL